MPTSSKQNKLQKIVNFGFLCLKKWPWFLASVVVSVAFAVVYLYRAQPQYTREAQLLIKEDSKNRTTSVSDLNAITDLGIFSSATNVNNELSRIQSPTLIGNVVKRLHLDVDYMKVSPLRQRTVYGEENPIVVEILGLEENEPCEFELILDSAAIFKYVKENTQAEAAKESKEKASKIKESADHTEDDVESDSLQQESNRSAAKSVELEKPKFTIRSLKFGKDEIEGEWDGRFETSLNIHKKVRVLVSHNIDYKGYGNEKPANLQFPQEILVIRRGFVKSVEFCKQKLNVSLIDKKSTVLNLSYQDAVAERAEDFLIELVEAYNKNLLEGKNKIAESTSRFITDRLSLIERELGNVDENISTYKSKNLTPDVSEVAKLHLDKASMASDKVSELDAQHAMLEYIRDFIADTRNKDFLPAVTNITNSVIEKSIEEYNALLVKRNSLVANSSEKNPMVITIDKNLADMAKGILINIDSQIDALDGQILNLRRTEAKSKAKIASSPSQTKYLLGVERQQKVKEALYLFLLQKREENELSQAFSAYNNQIITQPTGKLESTSPIKKNILMVAILLGILIPGAIIWMIESTKGRVYKLEDLEESDAKIMGEIPFDKKDLEKVVVSADKNNKVNAAFRTVRTNLEIAKSDEGANSMMISALHDGSGKDFFAINLAKVFALKQKKTIYVDFDVNSKALGKSLRNNEEGGIYDYLSQSNPTLQNFIKQIANEENLCVIPAGKTPDNPSDLLNESKLQTLMTFLKASFEVVIVNCPSAVEESATELIGKLVDRTVFVLNTENSRKNSVKLISSYVEEEKFNGISVVLNHRVG